MRANIVERLNIKDVESAFDAGIVDKPLISLVKIGNLVHL